MGERGKGVRKNRMRKKKMGKRKKWKRWKCKEKEKGKRVTEKRVGGGCSGRGKKKKETISLGTPPNKVLKGTFQTL